MPPLGEPGGRFRGPGAQPQAGLRGAAPVRARRAQPERGPGGGAPGGAQGRSPAHRAERDPARGSAHAGSRRGAALAKTDEGGVGSKPPDTPYAACISSLTPKSRTAGSSR
ncbi:hypothetical protein GCM10010357_37600 [Streptomyces luteireticuli]|uniref:Uncharacterized protein n=1 Tax=Streptomyces luteireticuli TaxID=173858 RepID=A0ABN0YVU4_9ACTN